MASRVTKFIPKCGQLTVRKLQKKLRFLSDWNITSHMWPWHSSSWSNWDWAGSLFQAFGIWWFERFFSPLEHIVWNEGKVLTSWFLLPIWLTTKNLQGFMSSVLVDAPFIPSWCDFFEWHHKSKVIFAPLAPYDYIRYVLNVTAFQVKMKL